MIRNASMASLPKCLQESMIYATIDCTNDGENGFPHRQAAGVADETRVALSGHIRGFY
jgi:hypothetical protein